MGSEMPWNMGSRLPCSVLEMVSTPISGVLAGPTFPPMASARSWCPKAHPQIGPPHVHDECADSRLLSAHPRVLIFLPHILGAPHYNHEIVWLEIWNLLPFVELDRVPAQSVLAKEVPKNAGMLADDMLKYEYFHRFSMSRAAEPSEFHAARSTN